ncbi:gliding motility-associated protein GldE [Flavobacterium sp. MFBS3-15]|uniref:gliding motility-associated protein GldE n=1 Tax=Flavobacterium sp. MFBS3-15 TaxID=2989816 RepID=UPI002235CA6B|nr:gliding motility-associated protein GldE [Flavobacterium sp. MFBS3-15]MCW4468158.1 gliding motility-associated protein GldE [Flavobacterium sp. MFBS3-15]
MDPDPSSFSTIDYNLILGFAGIAILLFFSAVLSGTETAFFSLTLQDIEKIRVKSPKKGKIISALLERPKKLLATLTIANTFVNISIIIFFFRLDAFSAIHLPWLRFIVEVAVIALLVLLFGEVVPKVYAVRNNRRLSKRVAMPLQLLSRILSPLSIPMREITLKLQARIGGQRNDLSVDRLSQALELTDYGDASAEEHKLLEGIVAFGSTEVTQVMTPRIDVFALDIEIPFVEALPNIVSMGYSRIPVYRGNIDRIEGVLFTKDLLPHIDSQDFEWQGIIREPFFVPENKKLDDLLREFQGMKNHLAIVVDEYGDTSGIISLEDILEEIVGDISDEFDDEDIIFSKIDDRTYLFDGKILLKDFYRICNVEEEDFEAERGEAETLAGLLLELSGNFPEKGEKIKFKGNIFTVEMVDRTRIKQIKVTLS